MAEFKASVDIRSSVRWGYLNRTFGEIGKALADPTIVFSCRSWQLPVESSIAGGEVPSMSSRSSPAVSGISRSQR